MSGTGEGSCGRSGSLHTEKFHQALGRPHRRSVRARASLFPLPAAGVGTAVKQALGQEELLQPLGIAAVGAGQGDDFPLFLDRPPAELGQADQQVAERSFIESDRRAFLDLGLRNIEEWGFPMSPDYVYTKAPEWEIRTTPDVIRQFALPQGLVVELKYLDGDSNGFQPFANDEIALGGKLWDIGYDADSVFVTYTGLSVGLDGDFDGVKNELTIGDQTALGARRLSIIDCSSSRP